MLCKYTCMLCKCTCTWLHVLPNLQASTGGFVKVLIACQKFNLIRGSVYTAAKVKLNTTCTGSVK